MSGFPARWKVDQRVSEPGAYVGSGPVNLYQAHSAVSWAVIEGLADDQGKRVAQAFLYWETYT